MSDPTLLGPDEEPDPLGTPATYSKRAGPDGKGESASEAQDRAASRARRKRFGVGTGAVLIALAVIGLALVPILGSSFKKTPRDRVGISYGGGPFEGSHFQKVVQPGSSLFFNGLFDRLYLYPADQQNLIIAKVPDGDDTPASDDSVVAPSSDRVQVEYQVAVYYKLNTDKLREFHEQHGLKFHAFTTAGWGRLINDTLRQQVENALQEETRRYEVADIYGDAELLVKIQDSVQVTLRERLEAAMGGAFFCGPNFSPGGECSDPVFIIKRADVPETVSAAYERNRTTALGIIARQNETQQRIEEAKGIQALSAALAESGQTYALLKAIESGKINFWVLPSDSGVNLTAPGQPTPPEGG